MNDEKCPLSFKLLRDVQVFSHIPFFAVAIMIIFMFYQALYFKQSYSAAYVLAAIFVLVVPAIASSMMYHALPKPGPWGDADIIQSNVCILFLFGLLLYYWSRVGFIKSFKINACVPYLSGFLAFSISYMIGLYTIARKAYYDNPLSYHMNHIQWHVMGAMSFVLSIILLYLFLHHTYN